MNDGMKEDGGDLLFGLRKHISAAPSNLSQIHISDRIHRAWMMLAEIGDRERSEICLVDSSPFKGAATSVLYARWAFFDLITAWCWHIGLTDRIAHINMLNDKPDVTWSQVCQSAIRFIGTNREGKLPFESIAKKYMAEILTAMPREFPFWDMTRDAIVISRNPNLPPPARKLLTRSLEILRSLDVWHPAPNPGSGYRYGIDDERRVVLVLGKRAQADSLMELIEYIYKNNLPEGEGYECFFQTFDSAGRGKPALGVIMYDGYLEFTDVPRLAWKQPQHE